MAQDRRKLADVMAELQPKGGPGVSDYDAYWRARAEVGHERNQRHDRTVALVKSELAPGSKILDLGVGDAHYYRSLMAEYEMRGVEISQAMIDGYDFDKQAIVRMDLNVEFPEFGSPFDGVIASQIFHHMDDPASLARNIARVLVPEGVLFVTAPNLWHLKNRLRVLRGTSPRFSPAHRNFMTPAELSELIARSGLQLLRRLPARPSENGGLAALWPSLGASQLLLVFRKTASGEQGAKDS